MEEGAATHGEMPLLRSEFLVRIVGELADPQNVGETPQGVRRIFCMKGGSFSGPRLACEVLPGGGDWVLIRRDGICQLDIRMTLRTNDKELIYVNCNGILDMAPEVRERILGGEMVGVFATGPSEAPRPLPADGSFSR
jgi:Protein of unknown function (DUF3237)